MCSDQVSSVYKTLSGAEPVLERGSWQARPPVVPPRLGGQERGSRHRRSRGSTGKGVGQTYPLSTGKRIAFVAKVVRAGVSAAHRTLVRPRCGERGGGGGGGSARVAVPEAPAVRRRADGRRVKQRL